MRREGKQGVAVCVCSAASTFHSLHVAICSFAAARLLPMSVDASPSARGKQLHPALL
jgi:hypothetical protein